MKNKCIVNINIIISASISINSARSILDMSSDPTIRGFLLCQGKRNAWQALKKARVHSLKFAGGEGQKFL